MSSHRTKAISLSAILFGSQLAFGAAGACPVTVSNVKRDTGLGDRNTYCFSLDATNNSGKNISSVEFHAAAVDSKHVTHVLNYDYPLDKIPAGETKLGYYSSHRLLGSDYQGIRVWVNRVLYADHTTWEDDGKRSCGSQDVKK
jgi:hypothetical protein